MLFEQIIGIARDLRGVEALDTIKDLAVRGGGDTRATHPVEDCRPGIDRGRQKCDVLKQFWVIRNLHR